MLERFDYKNLVAGVYVSALFMQIMDGTIINVALPTLAEQFDVDATAMDWTVLSFTIALAVMTACAGWFGGRFGLKKTFLVALAGFVGTSVMCGAAQTLDQLVVGRGLQGGFAGVITPVGSALLFNSFPIEERAAAARKAVTVAVIAPAVGPIVGGAIIEFLSWRWIFFVNVPIGGIALAMGWSWLKSDEPAETGGFDISGFVLLAAGLGLGLYGLSRGGDRGWTSPSILVSLIAGVSMLIALVRVELTKDQPLLEFAAMRDRLFRTCNLLTFPTYAAFLSLIYLLPLFLQNEAGHSPLTVGLAVFPQPIGVLLMSQIVGRFVYKRIGPRRLLFTGTTLGLVIGVAISRIDIETGLSSVRALMFCRGLAMGMVFVPIQTAVYARVDRERMTRATAIYGTSRQIAPALGVAIVSTVLASGIGGTVAGSVERVNGYQQALLASALMFGVAAVIALAVKDEDAAATMGS